VHCRACVNIFYALFITLRLRRADFVIYYAQTKAMECAMASAQIAARIGERVRAGRRRMGLTRKQFAAKAAISERYLNELEGGASNASIAVIAKVADALGQSPASLLSDGDPEATGTRPVSAELQTLVRSMSATEQQAVLPLAARWLVEQRRASKGIALLGLRGAGKSTLGKLLASRHGVPLLSVTREIERRAGMGLNEIFNLGGPEAYRAMENDVVSALVERGGKCVLETAGGIASNNEAMTTILARYKTVWLKASPDEHLSRVARQGDLRPMQGNPTALEHLRTLLASREAEYGRADLVIDTAGRSVEDCFAELQALTAGAFVAA
jgi:XRE family transcriptional regulator, aerobic/anaerobic benzoate catabolism transcriptional regulator